MPRSYEQTIATIKTDANGNFDFGYTSDNLYHDLDFVLVDNGESIIISGLSTKKDIQKNTALNRP